MTSVLLRIHAQGTHWYYYYYIGIGLLAPEILGSLASLTSWLRPLIICGISHLCVRPLGDILTESENVRNYYCSCLGS